MLSECQTGGPDTYAGINIAINIFFNIGYWLLLFVVIYVLNIMLRRQLGGPIAIFKVICLVIVGVMLALICGYIGVTCYNAWTVSEAGLFGDLEPLYQEAAQLGTATNVLALVSILAGGGLALMTLFSLRSRQHPASVSSLHPLCG